MAGTSKRKIEDALLAEHGRTFCEELRIHVERNAPSSLFQLLCASVLFSTRIGAGAATSAMRALLDKGWTTPKKMDASTWRQRTDALNRAGYARYDESTSRYLGDLTGFLLERYKGDLRRLREEAGRDPEAERRKLRDFKGIGRVGADIFMREVQVAWDEVFPFMDKKAADSAERLGLSADPRRLARGRSPAQFARLVSALVRVDLRNAHDEVLDKAA